MLNILRQHFNGLKPSVYSSLAMAFAGVGDAFLYPFLPLYAPAIGIPVVWVGVLLSVNRFARVFLSIVVIKGFKALGVRNVTIAASLLAICSTIGYGLNAGIIVWLLSRIIWGLCFSVLRTSSATYAINSARKGFALGVSNGIYETGPLLTLSAAPIIVMYFPVENAFYLLSIISSLSLFFALRLPHLEYVPPKDESKTLCQPSIINILTFVTSILEGVMIIAIGFFVQKHYSLPDLGAASIAAGFLIFRRACLVIISPIAGAWSDRLGVKRMIVVSILCMSTGFILVIANVLLAGLIIIFGFNAVANLVLPVAALNRAPDQVKTITANSVYKDAGTAAGTLAGGFLVANLYVNEFLLVIAAIQVFLVLYWAKTVKL
ncbi:MAG TPA: MFS transporter [Chitinophagaceae bacterium]|nr:MFS transporter [Chitinophagaceae bacterium]